MYMKKTLELQALRKLTFRDETENQFGTSQRK
jgi:hypothetical protein